MSSRPWDELQAWYLSASYQQLHVMLAMRTLESVLFSRLGKENVGCISPYETQLSKLTQYLPRNESVFRCSNILLQCTTMYQFIAEIIYNNVSLCFALCALLKSNIWCIHVCLFDLFLYVPSTIFQLYRDGSPGLNQYLARINVSCSRTTSQ